MRISETPRHRLGFLEARPCDVAGRSGLFWLDVREERELDAPAACHIHGVHSVPLERLMHAGVPELSTDTPIVVVCHDGRDSAKGAAALVRAHGFREVYHLVGGMVRWRAEERPVARRPTWRRHEG